MKRTVSNFGLVVSRATGSSHFRRMQDAIGGQSR